MCIHKGMYQKNDIWALILLIRLHISNKMNQPITFILTQRQVEDLQKEDVETETPDTQMELRPAPTVIEMASHVDFVRYDQDENRYIFSGMEQLVQIIKNHNGNVEIFLLPNSTLQSCLYWVGKVVPIKKMAVYVPSQVFPVQSNSPSTCRICRAHDVELCNGLCELCELFR